MTAKVGDDASDRAARVADDLRRAGVTALDERDELAQRHLRTELRGEGRDERLRRRHRLEAAAVAAPAEQAVRLDRHVADLPGEARCSDVEASADDEAGADSAA